MYITPYIYYKTLNVLLQQQLQIEIFAGQSKILTFERAAHIFSTSIVHADSSISFFTRKCMYIHEYKYIHDFCVLTSKKYFLLSNT